MAEDALRFVVEAALTPAELDAFAAWATTLTYRLVPPTSAWLIWSAGGVLAILVAFAAVLSGAVPERSGAATAALLFAAYLGGMQAVQWTSRRYQRRVTLARRARSGYLQERRRFEFRDDGIAVEGRASAFWPWTVLTAAESPRGLLVLSIGPVAQGFAIPLRAFASPEQAAAALAFAQARIAAARG